MILLSLFFVNSVRALVAVDNGLNASNDTNIAGTVTVATATATATTVATTVATGNPDPVQGWTSSPNSRGTMDILWTCVVTIFLCSWSVLCPNLPSPGDSSWRKFRRKFYLTSLGILGPEFVFQMALGQWVSACDSVKEFTASGYPSWTINHGFFADMGGFVLESPDYPPFPIDSKQVHYLVTNGYIAYPPISKTNITEKNEKNTFMRLVTIAQTLWFFINAAGRWAQGLPMTTIELTTLAFICCSLGTFFLWAHKPTIELEASRVVVPLLPPMTVSTIISKQPPSTRDRIECLLTPLSFIQRHKWTWKLYWSYGISFFQLIGISFTPKHRPVTRIPNDTFPAVTTWPLMFMIILFQLMFIGIHIAAWNFHFPTPKERLLWRMSTSAMLVAFVLYWSADQFSVRLLPWFKVHVLGRKKSLPGDKDHVLPPPTNSSGKRRPCCGWAESLRNISSPRDPDLRVPLKAIIPVGVAVNIYLASRAYILIEDFLALRRLPTGAFQTVDWSIYIPHWA
jgi:hypothetical protein